VIHLRWRVIFEPICWLLDHSWVSTESGRRCYLCARFVPWMPSHPMSRAMPHV
jgi:hypothetical protein